MEGNYVLLRSYSRATRPNPRSLPYTVSYHSYEPSRVGHHVAVHIEPGMTVTWLVPMITASAVLCAPICAAAVVSIASRREDARGTLTRPARGLIQTVARRLVGFHIEGDWPEVRCRSANHAQRDTHRQGLRLRDAQYSAMPPPSVRGNE